MYNMLKLFDNCAFFAVLASFLLLFCLIHLSVQFLSHSVQLPSSLASSLFYPAGVKRFDIFDIYQAFILPFHKALAASSLPNTHSFCPPVSLSAVPHPVLLIIGRTLGVGVVAFFLQSKALCSNIHILIHHPVTISTLMQ